MIFLCEGADEVCNAVGSDPCLKSVSISETSMFGALYDDTGTDSALKYGTYEKFEKVFVTWLFNSTDF